MIKNVVADRIAKLEQEQLSSWKEIHRLQDGDTLELDWKTLPQWTPEHRSAASSAISEWCLAQTVASEALACIEKSDARIGAWLACASARSVVHMLPSKKLPHIGTAGALHEAEIMLSMVESWVQGRYPLQLIRDLSSSFKKNMDESLNFSGASELEHVRMAAMSSYVAVLHASMSHQSTAGKSAHYAAMSIASSEVLRFLHAMGSRAASRTASYWGEQNMSVAIVRANRELLEVLAHKIPSAIENAAEGYEKT